MTRSYSVWLCMRIHCMLCIVGTQENQTAEKSRESNREIYQSYHLVQLSHSTISVYGAIWHPWQVQSSFIFGTAVSYCKENYFFGMPSTLTKHHLHRSKFTIYRDGVQCIHMWTIIHRSGAVISGGYLPSCFGEVNIHRYIHRHWGE